MGHIAFSVFGTWFLPIIFVLKTDRQTDRKKEGRLITSDNHRPNGLRGHMRTLPDGLSDNVMTDL